MICLMNLIYDYESEYEACEISDFKMLILILMSANLFDISKRLPTAFDNICTRDFPTR